MALDRQSGIGDTWPTLHAELTVTYESGDIVPSLQAALPPENRNVLSNSLVFGQNPAWQELVDFATETPQWRLAMYRSGATELQITIEPVLGNLKGACESVWRTIRGNSGPVKPTLRRLDLVDEATTQVVARGSVGFLPQVKRRELWLPILVALATAVVLVATGGDEATLRGAVPAFIAGTAALLSMVIDAMRKNLVWHG